MCVLRGGGGFNLKLLTFLIILCGKFLRYKLKMYLYSAKFAAIAIKF